MKIGKEYLEFVAVKYATIKRFTYLEELAFFCFLRSDKVSYSLRSSYLVNSGMLNMLYELSKLIVINAREKNIIF
ncbi:unnamed protein product [Commensalibacter papalotli (ex Botero et al. 2024)]|uniref:Uncharacterized protein n=1 Tax=Commensalibacter papalotli (ex Botero et al. 2024) TaxID=2972766 RepID=A0ABM9HP30_9PROT|nr:unnamed protein product [Commensalibacter papalotli (ex Botero et al. 2024)]